MLNALTIDVEDWYHTNGLDLPIEAWSGCEDRLAGNMMKLIRLLDRYEAKATFFVLGCVAQKHPDIVKELARRGHEIGSHGGWHRMLTKLAPEQFREDLKFSKSILESLSGRPVELFRAPSWSLQEDRYEMLRIMEQEGFRIDSSIQPFQTPLSGARNAPLRPFYPVLGGERLRMVEFPSTVLQVGGMKVPFSGGFYLRALPSWFAEWSLRQVNRSGPGMVYFHPWEFETNHPKLEAPISPYVRLAQYYNLKSTEAKLERLLQRFSFAPLGQVVERYGHQFPELALA